ncbi:unnamed protein product [Adineta steineri]|uniref:Uncharacterized protein n=1 Tax=Adineta steineri TaxID=433720 RepID=A0A815H6T0_9BILA|nr:unnamed protein product [Adineta steineri]CAF1349996.1 unnamed protein product [Adineta steineri]
MVLIIRKKKNGFLKSSFIFFILVPFIYYISFHHQSLNTPRNETSLNLYEYNELPIQWNNHPRGVIVTLMRSTNHSIFRIINMIHSIVLFHSTNDQFQYPFLIFHDQNFTLSMRQYILSCVNNHKKKLNILFIRLNFLTEAQLPDKFIRRRKLGYHQMCRFWSYDVFYHPAIVKSNYDYLMRMDDDSYFWNKTKIDLFHYIDEKKLDYIYRSWYDEDNQALFPIEKQFFNRKKSRTNCIYNNFFIIRLQWLYKSERVLRFLHELIRDDLLLREYIGDGCIHAAMLDIDRDVKTEQLKQLPYGHNHHIMLINREGPYFNPSMNFSQALTNSCNQLIFISDNTTEIKRIKI